jgi:transposase
VGIDVSKAWLDVAGRRAPAPSRVANDPDGIAALVADLRALAPELVVLEATGGLELPVVAALQVAGLPVAVVNPRQVRDVAQATGQLAKTDRLDAALLARFAGAIRPAAAVPDDVRHLDALLTRRSQLIAMRVIETNRLDRLTDAEVRREVQKPVTWLTKAIDRADAAIAGAVKASLVWRARGVLLQSIPGAGPAATVTLLASLPELGATTGGRLAAPVGRAPFADDSGSVRRSARPRGSGTGSPGTVPGSPLGGHPQPGHAGVQGAVGGPREAAEGEPDGGRSEVAGDRQRDHPVRSAVAGEGSRSKRTGKVRCKDCRDHHSVGFRPNGAGENSPARQGWVTTGSLPQPRRGGRRGAPSELVRVAVADPDLTVWAIFHRPVGARASIPPGRVVLRLLRQAGLSVGARANIPPGRSAGASYNAPRPSA